MTFCNIVSLNTLQIIIFQESKTSFIKFIDSSFISLVFHICYALVWQCLVRCVYTFTVSHVKFVMCSEQQRIILGEPF